MADTAALLALLQRHYIKPGGPAALPGGTFLPEVGQNGGWGSGRRCDAIYVGFTSSSGRMLVGHELKISRADWLNELSKPGKADTWADECHEWWLVVSDPAIVHEGELPAGWGLMSPGKSKTRMQIHAQASRKPNDHRPSWNAVRSVMARQDTLRAQASDRARADAYAAANAEVKERVEQRIKDELSRGAHDSAQVTELRERIRMIEKALGHNIVWSDKPAGFANQTTITEIEKIRDVLTQTRSVSGAVRRLSTCASGYQVSSIQDALDSLRRAIEQVTANDD